jgi:hypothetical protein
MFGDCRPLLPPLAVHWIGLNRSLAGTGLERRQQSRCGGDNRPLTRCGTGATMAARRVRGRGRHQLRPSGNVRRP